MSAEPKTHYTLPEYFALEQASDIRYEYWDGEIFAMSGASPNHNRITADVARILGNQLLDRCEVFASDMRVKIPLQSRYVYPDVIVVYGKPEFETIEGLATLLNPSLVVEVLSLTTEDKDLGKKFEYYRSLSTLKEYILIAQDRVHVAQYVKQSENVWLFTEMNDITGTFHLPSIQCVLILNEVYRRVQLSEPETSLQTE